jgi:hypothetical protein
VRAETILSHPFQTTTANPARASGFFVIARKGEVHAIGLDAAAAADKIMPTKISEGQKGEL